MGIDPVVDAEVSNIAYDVAAAKILFSGPKELYRQTLINNTDQPQTTSINGSTSVSETSGWTDTTSYKIGVSAKFTAGIPFLGDTGITVSADVTTTYSQNASTQTSRTWGFTAPVTVPKNSTIVAVVVVTTSTISVPYTLTGTILLRSGARLPGRTVNGVYTGTNSHDLTVTYYQQDPATGQVLATQGQATELSHPLQVHFV
jgi:hypothetical protein